MNVIYGIALVISLMILIFLGPEYFESLQKRRRTYKKSATYRRQILSRD